MNPINTNKPISIALILFDNLMDSERDISFLSALPSVVEVIFPTILSLKFVV